jgi:uncharacterized glyoxalase superfamily protein PhnB
MNRYFAFTVSETLWLPDISEGGGVFMPLKDTFWGARYAKLTGQFGVNWDLNCQL